MYYLNLFDSYRSIAVKYNKDAYGKVSVSLSLNDILYQKLFRYMVHSDDESGKINFIITKYLFRLGRNYLQPAIFVRLLGIVNFARKYDWISVDWKKFVLVISVLMVLIYPHF